MDGEPVEGKPSKEYGTFTEVFIALCPYYMEMGMSYHDFWHMNTSCHRAYREAYQIRRKNDEWGRWRMGAYVFSAIMCAAPVIKPFVKDAKPGEYPDRPWPITQKEAEEQEREKEIATYQKVLEHRRAQVKRRKEEEAIKEAGGDG